MTATRQEKNSAGEQVGCVPNVAVREAGSSPASQLRRVEASEALKAAVAYMRSLLSEGYHDNLQDAATDAARVHHFDRKSILREYRQVAP